MVLVVLGNPITGVSTAIEYLGLTEYSINTPVIEACKLLYSLSDEDFKGGNIDLITEGKNKNKSPRFLLKNMVKSVRDTMGNTYLVEQFIKKYSLPDGTVEIPKIFAVTGILCEEELNIIPDVKVIDIIRSEIYSKDVMNEVDKNIFFIEHNIDTKNKIFNISSLDLLKNKLLTLYTHIYNEYSFQELFTSS